MPRMVSTTHTEAPQTWKGRLRSTASPSLAFIKALSLRPPPMTTRAFASKPLCGSSRTVMLRWLSVIMAGSMMSMPIQFRIRTMTRPRLKERKPGRSVLVAAAMVKAETDVKVVVVAATPPRGRALTMTSSMSFTPGPTAFTEEISKKMTSTPTARPKKGTMVPKTVIPRPQYPKRPKLAPPDKAGMQVAPKRSLICEFPGIRVSVPSMSTT
mmetsp:Transcript_88165/g.210585  ORF Transcript_88165/g.210585 Transcript_88165/m.210585 type:complete len:212 (+) Transcript_88165:1457-2092(+)